MLRRFREVGSELCATIASVAWLLSVRVLGEGLVRCLGFQ